MSLPAGFAAKVMPSTCLVWVGATNNLGYGIITRDGRQELAHRVAYEDAYGPIPAGLVVDHKCRVRNCVKPEHLEPVTSGENSRRGRVAAALKPGDECTNGHRIETAADIYARPSGKTECRKCRTSVPNRRGERRPTRQRRSEAVVEALALADSALQRAS